MYLVILRYVALVLVALDLGMALCHTLEMPAKLAATGPQWLLFQHTLYRAFGSGGPGAPIEIGAILVTVLLAWSVRGHGHSFLLTLVGAVCVGAAFFVVRIVFVAPVNSQTAQWTAETLPANWESLRAQWEYAHATRFVLQLIGFSALTLSVLVDTKASRAAHSAG